MGSSTYLLAFESLTDVNVVKRGYPNSYLPMRRLPACVAKAGCGFCLSLPEGLVAEVRAVAVRAGIRSWLYRVEPADDGPTQYRPIDIGAQ